MRLRRAFFRRGVRSESVGVFSKGSVPVWVLRSSDPPTASLVNSFAVSFTCRDCFFFRPGELLGFRLLPIGGMQTSASLFRLLQVPADLADPLTSACFWQALLPY
jgi:hypothetical protein